MSMETSAPGGGDWRNFPVFINSRDRLAPLAALTEWLLNAGHRRLYILDNASSYPPLLAWYGTVDRERVRVFRFEENLGHKALWLAGIPRRMRKPTPFVYTDSDILPAEGCPPNAVEHFQRCLAAFPDIRKVGFGLKIDDIPDHYQHKRKVLAWETQFWANEIQPGLHRTLIDTTFALYRPDALEYELNAPALRTGGAYVARHLTWYMDSAAPTAEELYYRDHASPTVTTWSRPELPQHMELIIGEMMRQNRNGG